MKSKLALFLLIAVGTAVAAFCYYKHAYPYGHRPCCLPCTMEALEDYAREHDKQYPEGVGDGVENLQLLYPKYLQEELAGISGDRAALMKVLRGGGKIKAGLSSWEYFPGFRSDDDGRIAIIWEKAAGIGPNGARFDGHSVAFAGGGVQQIASADWVNFLQEQEVLRRTAREKVSMMLEKR